MDPSSTSAITTMLEAAARGEPDAERRLIEHVYEELRVMASQRLAHDPLAKTIRSTELVHETYVRLFGAAAKPSFRNHAHFFGAVSEAMRRVLVDRARSRARLKRGGGAERVGLDVAEVGFEDDPGDVLAFDEVLTNFEAMDPRAAEIVKLRCFAGLSIAETADALGVSTRTVDRDWIAAKAWLKSELAGVPADDATADGSRTPS